MKKYQAREQGDKVWGTVEALDATHAAETYAEEYSLNDDDRLFRGFALVEVMVGETIKTFRVHAEADVYYHANEVE